MINLLRNKWFSRYFPGQSKVAYLDNESNTILTILDNVIIINNGNSISG